MNEKEIDISLYNSMFTTTVVFYSKTLFAVRHGLAMSATVKVGRCSVDFRKAGWPRIRLKVCVFPARRRYLYPIASFTFVIVPGSNQVDLSSSSKFT